MLGSFWGGRRRDKFGWKAYFFPEKYLVLVWKRRRGPYSLCIGWRREGGVHPVCTCWEYYGLTGVKECWRKTLESDEQVQHWQARRSLQVGRAQCNSKQKATTHFTTSENQQRKHSESLPQYTTHTAQQLVHRFWAIGQPKLFSYLLAPNIKIHRVWEYF